MTPLERPDLHAAIETRYPDNNSEDITPQHLREGLHELVDSVFVTATDTGAVANVPVYDPVATYAVGYLVRYTPPGNGLEAFYYALLDGKLPAPTGYATDSHWKVVPGPVPATQLAQALTLAQAQAINGDLVVLGRAYAIELPAASASGHQQLLSVVGIAENWFASEGWLVVNNVRTKIRNIDYVAGTWDVDNGGSGGGGPLPTNLATTDTAQDITASKTFTVPQYIRYLSTSAKMEEVFGLSMKGLAGTAYFQFLLGATAARGGGLVFGERGGPFPESGVRFDLNKTNLYQGGNYPIAFWTNDEQRLFIWGDGNVSIGNYTSTRKLSVTGDAQVTTLFIDNLRGAGSRLVQVNSSGEVVADPNAPKWNGSTLQVTGSVQADTFSGDLDLSAIPTVPAAYNTGVKIAKALAQLALQQEDIVSVFPINTISTAELPIVYTKWTGVYLNYAVLHLTAPPEIKVNGVVAAFPLTLKLGDIVRITATGGGNGAGIVTLLRA